jgi:hypothetical protein
VDLSGTRRRRRPAGKQLASAFSAQLSHFLIVFPDFGRNFWAVRAEVGGLGWFGTDFSGGRQFRNANLDA